MPFRVARVPPERIAGADAGLGIVLGERPRLVQPFPQDAQADLAGGHVFHQVEDVVVAEEVGTFELKGFARAVSVSSVLGFR